MTENHEKGIIQTLGSSVKCDGGDDERGHPAVFLDLTKSQQATCPYCGIHYVSKKQERSTSL